MGIVKDVISGITGATAAKRAANAQQAAADQASALQKTAEGEALERGRIAEEKARADLQPFTAAGTRAIGGLEEGLADVSRLVTDPEAQKEFITDNVFFDALAGRATSELFANQAARGKVGSGGTAEALQESILLLGSDLLNQNITQRQNVNTQFQNLVNTGKGAATAQAEITQGAAGRDISTITGVATQRADLRQDAGTAQARGIVGAQNVRQRAADNVEARAAEAAKAIALCDRAAKKDIKQIGRLDNGLPIYSFRYKGDDTLQLNVMAQDVEKINPSAVFEINGMKHINTELAWH